MRSKKERSFALSFSSQEKPMLRGEVHACPHGLAFEVEDTRPPPSALKSQTQKYPIARDPSWLTGGFDSWPRNSYMLWAWPKSKLIIYVISVVVTIIITIIKFFNLY